MMSQYSPSGSPVLKSLPRQVEVVVVLLLLREELPLLLRLRPKRRNQSPKRRRMMTWALVCSTRSTILLANQSEFCAIVKMFLDCEIYNYTSTNFSVVTKYDCYRKK